MILNKKQQLNLLDLYSYEIKSRIALNPLKIAPFRDFISKIQMEYLESNLDDLNKFANDLWKSIRNSPLNAVLYERVLVFLKSGILLNVEI